MFQVLFLLLIEIIIQQDLVWDKDTGKLTGYMNLGNTIWMLLFWIKQMDLLHMF